MILKGTDLKQRLESLVYHNGGDLCGVADLEPARAFITAQGGEALGNFPRAVSIGIRLSDVIVDQHRPEERRYALIPGHALSTAVLIPAAGAWQNVRWDTWHKLD